MLTPDLKAKPQPAAFVTFGLVCQTSNVHEPAQLGQYDLFTRTVHVCPVSLEWERQVTAAHLALGRHEPMYVANYSGGVAFQTKVENKPNGVYFLLWIPPVLTPTNSLPAGGSGRKGFNRAVSATTHKAHPLNYATFGTEGLKQCAKYASLSTFQDQGMYFVLYYWPR